MTSNNYKQIAKALERIAPVRKSPDDSLIAFQAWEKTTKEIAAIFSADPVFNAEKFLDQCQSKFQ